MKQRINNISDWFLERFPLSDLWNDHVEKYRKQYGKDDLRMRRRLERAPAHPAALHEGYGRGRGAAWGGQKLTVGGQPHVRMPIYKSCD